MNVFTILSFCILTAIAAIKVAPVAVDHYAVKERAELRVMMQAAEEQSAIEACANGTSQSYIYNGVRCKGFNL